MPQGWFADTIFQSPLRSALRPPSSQPIALSAPCTACPRPCSSGSIEAPRSGSTGLPWYSVPGCRVPASSNSVGAMSVTWAMADSSLPPLTPGPQAIAGTAMPPSYMKDLNMRNGVEPTCAQPGPYSA